MARAEHGSPTTGTGAVRLILLGAALIAGVGVARSAPPAPAATAAQVEKGRQLFLRCIACHARSASARPGTGPHLAGIVDRPVASVAGFRYTAQLQKQQFVWTRARLEQWLRQPQAQFPGMCVPFTGLPTRAEREALIAFLAS